MSPCQAFFSDQSLVYSLVMVSRSYPILVPVRICNIDWSCCADDRVFAFTRLNAHSSRSHAIVMLTIIKRHRTAPGQEEGPLQRVKIGKLFMVDLAGSERLKKSLSTGADLPCNQS